MVYCTKCVTPSTRPNVVIDENGVCSACRNYQTRPNIDWNKRSKTFADVVSNAKSKSTGYDCLIPVSGGKDSTWQVVKCLEAGLKPLAVTWKTPGLTEVGRSNLENLINLGVDHINYQISPKVEKKFMLTTFEKVGSSAVPMHMAIFNIPLRIALKFNIPLVVWGENSAFEYGNSEEESTGFKLNSAWRKKYGMTHGTTAENWISKDITLKDLTAYREVTDQELDDNGILAVFLGYYFPWDPAESYRVAKESGFKSRQEGPKTGYYNYADIDDHFISIHHYLKWYKFGFTRIFDNLSLEIRNKRLSRDEAISIIKSTGDQTPHEDIEKFCNFVGISKQRFFEICETFRNHKIWTNKNNIWQINNFLISDWAWDKCDKYGY
ncbi:MAG: N-acetyl sugar amidotransferase [Oligoflexia bacterium]|nr:N-acetyl sugar amidotransferase [Oligoflexia bacterium]